VPRAADSGVPRIDVVRTYLQLRSRDALAGAASPDPRARIERVEGCPASFFRYLYAEVGRPYHWVDRLPWTDEQLRERLARPTVSLYLLSVAGSPAGYFELERHDDGSVEIAYFGLLPEFLGRGLGRYLLTEAATRAFDLGASRVWLHTCTLDDPAALPNYRARGFEPFKTETYSADLPEEPT
jgi:ribosomal protein S18 acetylase RimI-like enzyme